MPTSTYELRVNELFLFVITAMLCCPLFKNKETKPTKLKSEIPLTEPLHPATVSQLHSKILTVSKEAEALRSGKNPTSRR